MIVDVWTFSLQNQRTFLEQFMETLSADEKSRNDRLSNEQVRLTFVLSRGVLRELLAERLGIAPDAVRFTYGLHGKPGLDLDTAAGALHFSLSHSGDLAAIALAAKPVGIDVERIRTVADMDEIARRWFSPDDAETLTGLEGADRQLAFLQGWTNHEARLKADGAGLSGLDDAARLHGEWTTLPLEVPDGYVGAVAAQGPPRLRYHDLTPPHGRRQRAAART